MCPRRKSKISFRLNCPPVIRRITKPKKATTQFVAWKLRGELTKRKGVFGMPVRSPITLGSAARATELLGRMGVGQHHVQEVIDDPKRREAVAAAYRGEFNTGNISPEDWFSREMAVSDELNNHGMALFDEDQVRQASKGAPGLHCRFIPGGLGFWAFHLMLYNWNRNGMERIEDGIQWNWMSHDEVEELPTVAGVIDCDFRQVMEPDDLSGRPFSLDKRDQTAWAEKRGGSGLMTAEQVVYLFIRSIAEYHRPLWTVGWARCHNGSNKGSLAVGWHARLGLSVECWMDRGDDYTGAIPAIFKALDS